MEDHQDIVSDDVKTNCLFIIIADQYYGYDEKRSPQQPTSDRRPWWSLTGTHVMVDDGKRYACDILRVALRPSKETISIKKEEEKIIIQFQNRMSKRTLKNCQKWPQNLLFQMKKGHAKLQSTVQLPFCVCDRCAKE